jgi:hypothetical protein
MKTEIIVKAVIETTDEGATLQISGEVTPNNLALGKLPPEVMLHVTTGVAQAAEHLAETYAKVRLVGHLRELFDVKDEADENPQKSDNDRPLDKLRSRFSVN